MKAAHAFSYVPYHGLHSLFTDEPPGAVEMNDLEQTLIAGDWRETHRKSAKLIETTLKGLRYLQTFLFFFRLMLTANISYDTATTDGSFVPLSRLATQGGLCTVLCL